jgi:hypothetical protein
MIVRMMELRVMRQVLIALALCFLWSCRDRNTPPPPASVVPQPADHFVGTWRLNKNKSPQPKVGSYYLGSYPDIEESFTIERQGSGFKFPYASFDRKGAEQSREFVTDMKGGVVAIKNADSKNLISNIWVTRIDSDSFVENTTISHKESKVSADGKTLTVHRVIFADNEFERVFVFDRVR